MNETKRCRWVGTGKLYYEKYHDEEWGVAVYDDHKLFEMLILEGAQAGLSWETILKRRDGYRKAFKNFDVEAVSSMTDKELEDLLFCSDIIRNRLKVFSARTNAQIFLRISKEYGSFSSYLWRFVGGKSIINSFKEISDLPTTSIESDALSKDLKERGMKFVGSTIIYSYMQAIGMVNDHLAYCWLYKGE